MGPLTAPHWEALTSETRQAFRQVAALPFIAQFYLAGGTGLALHLGHRFSIDLDLFSANADAVGPDTRALLREAFDDPSLAITHDKDGTFVAIWRGVGVSFFRLSQYPLVQEPVLLEGIPLATVEEIGAMKLAAITDRGTRKDLNERLAYSGTSRTTFGSALREDFSSDSDLDILVTFGPEANWSLLDHVRMEQELAALLGRKIDLLAKRSVQRSHNPIRRQHILDTAEVIYGAR